MGHGSYGSWVRGPMGHMGRGSLSVTHCQLWQAVHCPLEAEAFCSERHATTTCTVCVQTNSLG